MKRFLVFWFLTFTFQQLTFSQPGDSVKMNGLHDYIDSPPGFGRGTSQGKLIQKMTTSERDKMISPAEGLLIFNITTNCFEVYVDSAWQPFKCPQFFCGDILRDSRDNQSNHLLCSYLKQKDSVKVNVNRTESRGDNYFLKGKYKKALKKYLKAHKEFPEDKTNSVKIKGIMDYLNSTSNKEKNNNKSIYNLMLILGDDFFLKHEYSKAKIAYQQASKIRNQEPYPLIRVKQIEEFKLDRNK